MNNKRVMTNIGDVYSKAIICEGKSKYFPKDTFKSAKDPENKKPFVDMKKSGPESEGNGFKKDGVTDPKKTKGKDFANSSRFSSDTVNTTKTLEKTDVEEINNHMSATKRSTFDKLFEDIMHDEIPDISNTEDSDAEALGIKDEEKGEGDELEGEEESLKDLVAHALEVLQKVHDALAEAEGEVGEEEGELGDVEHEDEDLEDETEHTEDELSGEATEIKELPDSDGKKLMGKSNKVAGTVTSEVDSAKADGKVKGEVDGKGKDMKKSPLEPVGGYKKDNKVAGRASQVGKVLFHK